MGARYMKTEDEIEEVCKKIYLVLYFLVTPAETIKVLTLLLIAIISSSPLPKSSKKKIFDKTWLKMKELFDDSLEDDDEPY